MSDGAPDTAKTGGRKKHKGIYLVSGPDIGRRRAAIAKLKEQLAGTHGQDLEASTYYSYDTPPAELLNQLYNQPLFGGFQFIIYYAVDELKGRDPHAQLLQYCKEPSSHAALVLVSSAAKLSYAWAKEIPERHRHQCWKPFANEMRGMLGDLFRQEGVEFTSDEMTMITDALSDQGSAAMDNARQIIHYHRAGHAVDAALVSQISGGAHNENIFSLVDALFARDARKAVGIGELLLQQGEDANQLVTIIARNFFQLWHWRCLRGAGVHLNEAFRKAGIMWQKQQRIFQAADHRFGRRELSELIMHISSTTANLRSGIGGTGAGLRAGTGGGSGNRGLIFTGLLLAICSGSPATPLPERGPSSILEQSLRPQPL